MTNRKLVILFLAANPIDTDQLHLDEEKSSIDNVLQKSEYRDCFELRSAWAVSYGNLQELLLRHKPHIVHFSGHGSPIGEIVLTNERSRSQLVQPNALAELFSILRDNVRCVVLNACYSEIQGYAIAQSIDCVVGMSCAIEDDAAINFAAGFYLGLGYGRNVQTAFKLGCNRIGLAQMGAVHRNVSLISPHTSQATGVAVTGGSAIPQLLSLHKNPSQLKLIDPVSWLRRRRTILLTAATAAIVIVIVVALIAFWPHFRVEPQSTAESRSSTAPEVPPTAIGSSEPTTRTTLEVTTIPAIEAASTSPPLASPVAATAFASAPTASPTDAQMVMITTKEEGGPVLSVIPDSLRFQGNQGLGLRSGEFVPFANILNIDVGDVKDGALPIAITFTDGITLAASLVKDADLLEGDTLHGAFQKHMTVLKRLEFPNQH